MTDTDRLAAVMAEQARHAAARNARHLNRRKPAEPPSPLHPCYCQDFRLPHDHQLGDHPGFTEDGAE
jgi:hypothetical protein